MSVSLHVFFFQFLPAQSYEACSIQGCHLLPKYCFPVHQSAFISLSLNTSANRDSSTGQSIPQYLLTLSEIVPNTQTDTADKTPTTSPITATAARTTHLLLAVIATTAAVMEPTAATTALAHKAMVVRFHDCWQQRSC